MQDLKLNKIANQQRKLLYVNCVLFSHLKAFVNLHFACGFKDLIFNQLRLTAWLTQMVELYA